MKLIISLILIIILIYFSYSKEHFQNALINMPKGFININGNFFSQGKYPNGPSSIVLDPNAVAEKYGKFSEINLDKKNMIVKQGYHVRNQLCLDDYCIGGKELSNFDDDKKIPRFYKKCVDYKRPLKSNESASVDTIWRDKEGMQCSNYNTNRCNIAEKYTPTSGDFNGMSAKDACCVCQSSQKVINGVKYNEISYNQDDKDYIPDLLCSRSKSGYSIEISGADPSALDGTYKSIIKNNLPMYKKGNYFIAFAPPPGDSDLKNSQWIITDKDNVYYKLGGNTSNLRWVSWTDQTRSIPFNDIVKDDSENEVCITGQEFRIINGTKTINIKSNWDNYDDYIRPYNTQFGDGNNNSGIRDYIFYQKDNDVEGINQNMDKTITKDKDGNDLDTCKKHVSTKGNCLSGSVTYEKIGDATCKIVYEDKWILRVNGIQVYYNDNTSDTNNVPTSGWKYKKKSFGNWGDGRHYRGTQNKTKHGVSCQKWTDQNPHGHSRTPQNYPGFGLGNHNYCRNPDGEPGIWCYTSQSSNRWDWCDPNTIQISRIDSQGSGESALKQVSVTGHSINDGKNINGIYRESKTEGHYCKDSGKAQTGADYGLEYIIIPGKKSNTQLVEPDDYTHIHDHSHSNSPHMGL